MIEVRIANRADRLPIRHMLELNSHDISKFWDMELDCAGSYRINSA